MARRRNQDSGPGLIRGLYDTVTGAPLELTRGVLDEADLLLGTQGGKVKGKNPKRKQKKRGNAGVVRLSEREAKRYGGKIKGLSIGSSARKPRTRGRKQGTSSRRRATKGMKRTYKASRAIGRGLKRGGKAVGRTAKAAGRGFWAGLFANPGAHHLRGAIPAKYQRMYEDIASSPYAKKKYGSRVKEVAARTALAHYAQGNPSGWASLKKALGVKANPAWMKAPKRRKRTRNSKRAFNEFRGRPAKSEYEMKVADGTPAHTKEAGGLEEMKVGGRLMRFNPSKARLLYKGNNLYLGGVRFGKRGGKNPGEEIDMGPVHTVVYHADKPHLGETRTVPYEHKFGEEGGKQPHLICDREGYPYFEGGSYRISPDGIIN